jgi:P4 family phage/plasmid primase-like protien
VLERLQRDGEIRFDQLTFWQWNGSRWCELSSDDIHVHIGKSVKGSSVSKRDGDYAGIVRLMRKMCNRRLSAHDIRGVNFANGFYSEHGELLPHSPDFGCTFTFPFAYDPDAAEACPQWLRLLTDYWGQEPDFGQRVLALQEAFAATLFGCATSHQRAFLLFGKGQSGKSQILHVLQALLPEEASCSLGPQHWGERFALPHLIGKAANICNELPESGKINGAVFKQVVDGVQMFSEHKGIDGFSFSPSCAQWFASNFLPWSSDSSDGFARRWLIFDFNRKVDAARIEPNIAARIVDEERHAIAAWAVEGLARLQQHSGYTLPACHDRRQREMRRANNTVLAFLEDSRAVRIGEGEIELEHLHALYRAHVGSDRAIRSLTVERFRHMLEELGYPVAVCHDDLGYPLYWVEGVVKAPDRKLRVVQ